MFQATEMQAGKAIATLKRAIHAAENSNQSGEDAVTRAAAMMSADAIDKLAGQAFGDGFLAAYLMFDRTTVREAENACAETWKDYRGDYERYIL